MATSVSEAVIKGESNPNGRVCHYAVTTGLSPSGEIKCAACVPYPIQASSYVCFGLRLPMVLFHRRWWPHTYCCNKFTSIYLGETGKRKSFAPECDRCVPDSPSGPVVGSWDETYQTCVLVVPGVRFVLACAGATLGRGRLVAIRTQVLADVPAAICCVIRQNIWRE